MPDNQLTPEEIQTLKELAKNIAAGSRVGQMIKGWLIGLAATLGAGLFIWEFIISRKT